MALHFLAHVRQAIGDYERATEMMERSVAQYQAADDNWGVANSVDCLGEVARSKGDYDRAATFTQRALALYAEIGEERGRSHVLHNLGYVRLHQGYPDEAAALFRESLVRAQEIRSTRDIILAVAGLAASRAQSRPPERVVQLLGAVDALLGAAGIHNEPAELADFDQAVAAARARLGEEMFDSAWSRGREMTLDAAVEDALALGAASARPEASQASRGGTPVGPLTPREREVVALIAQGLTNREIAASLVISERTAEGHVQSILNKLGFGSRTQIAAWAVKYDVADGHNEESA
jgi:non-specific serine/threonine protein kinase